MFPLVLLVAIGASASSLGAQDDLSAYEPLVGSWQGELEYLDYGDNQTLVTLPTWLVVERAESGKRLDVEFFYEEPDGREVGSRDQLYETPDGLYLGDQWTIEERHADEASGTLRLVLSREGKDDGREASIRRVIVVEGRSLTMTTHVEFTDTGDGLQRNEYRFVKSQPTSP
jgi:hypothetical protein